MQKITKKTLLYILSAFFLMLGLCVFLMMKIKNGGIFKSGIDSALPKRINVFLTPTVVERVLEPIRKYSVRNNVKISVSVMTENHLELAVATSEDGESPSAFIGYTLKEEDENDSRLFSREKIIGVTNNTIFEQCKSVKCDIVVKNVCNLYKLAKARSLKFFVSENLFPVEKRVREIYSKDCRGACEVMAKKMQMSDETEIMRVLESGKEGVVVVSGEMLPKALLLGGFVQKEFFGLFVYMRDSDVEKYLDKMISPAAFLEYIASDSSVVIINGAVSREMEEVRDVFVQGCEKEMIDEDFKVELLKPSLFFDKKGILFGAEYDVKSFGMMVYDNGHMVPVWSYCRNDSGKICDNMLKMTSRG